VTTPIQEIRESSFQVADIPEPVMSADADRPRPPRLARQGVLVVDDTVETLQVLVATLVAEGHQVRPANGGQQALDAIAARLPELVLLDVRMPGMDGFEVCRRLQEDEETRPIPILFLSSSTDAQERVHGLALGAVDFIPKPFQREELLARVRTHLELTRLRTRLEAQVEERTRNLQAAMLRIAEEFAQKEAAMRAQRESEEKYREIVENAPIAIYQRSLDGRFLFINPGLVQQFECSSPEEFMATYEDISRFWVGPQTFDEHRAQLLEKGSVYGCDTEFRLVDGTVKWFSLYSFLDRKAERIDGFSVDITQQKLSETERERLQVQLQKSQKLESIGTLAGGIAHDFNNILTVMMFNAELGMAAIDSGNPLWLRFSEILGAAKRSASLTRQLLAFARNQPVAPVVLDINRRIRDLLTMLRRLIGESIVLDWNPAPQLWRVRIDPSQIDQILANLCVNARDAIGGNGRIGIATRRLVLDEEAARQDTRIRPGEFVCIEVTDDGCGMDHEVQEHIFEPFFTTKEIGKGTGLGLSTVYGIVTQNRGTIQLESEPGKGTLFRILLPRVDGPEGEGISAADPSFVDTLFGTILLVEDSSPLRHAARTVLESKGFKVLAAAGPKEALQLAHLHGEAIDLLLTDVIMPEMNGRELAERIGQWRPAIQVLYMSGYASEVFTGGELSEGKVHFIQKPFQIEDLVAKVVDVMEAT
jgi:DNA-binding response OmpR family regulator/nitrogen-specific signal transduction histidine kinase